MRNNSAKNMALCGVTAALAVVIMCLGGIIPVATYICPMLCALLLSLVVPIAGKRLGWVWYAVVSILALLLGPDKEAAGVFLFLGYYPIIKPWLDQRKLSFLWKLVLFNIAILILYGLLIWVFGLEGVVEDFKTAGMVLTIATLILGNVCLFLLDMLLGIMAKRKRK